MPRMIEGTDRAAMLHFAVVHSRFNDEVTKRLLEGALAALRAGGVHDDAIDVVSVPGAFEIPLVAARLAQSGRYDAVICLGAVIRGETPHFDYISAVVSQGIARAAYDSGIPVIFGVLTCDTDAQADARSGRQGSNKGYEAGQAALAMATLMTALDAVMPSKHAGSSPRAERTGAKMSRAVRPRRQATSRKNTR